MNQPYLYTVSENDADSNQPYLYRVSEDDANMNQQYLCRVSENDADINQPYLYKVDGAEGPLDANVLHAGDNFLVGHQHLPDGRHVGFFDGPVQPLHKSAKRRFT